MKYSYPVGWIYPIFAAFRVLADSSSEKITWRRNAVDFWTKHGEEICRRFDPHLREAT